PRGDPADLPQRGPPTAAARDDAEEPRPSARYLDETIAAGTGPAQAGRARTGLQQPQPSAVVCFMPRSPAGQPVPRPARAGPDHHASPVEEVRARRPLGDHALWFTMPGAALSGTDALIGASISARRPC